MIFVSHRLADGKRRPLQKTKTALQKLLSQPDEVDEDEDVEDEVDDDDDDKVEGGGDGGGVGDGDEAKSQATHGDLDKEGKIADARQIVNKEKARQAAQKKAQTKAAADAIKAQEKAEKEKDKEGTRPSGLRRKKTTD